MNTPGRPAALSSKASSSGWYTAVTVPVLVSLAVSSVNLRGENKPQGKVSYYRDVRPILQANCQGCHQAAKAKGGYVMTDFKRLLAGGDSEGAAVVAKHPDKSSLLKMITPQDGEVRMPKGKT